MRNEFRTWPKTDTLTAKKKLVRRMRRLVRNTNKQLADKNCYLRIVRQDIKSVPTGEGWDALFYIGFYNATTNECYKIRKYPKTLLDFPTLLYYDGLKSRIKKIKTSS